MIPTLPGSWFVYLVTNEAGLLYIGISNDPERRLRAHNNGSGAKYTKGRGPWHIVYLEEMAGQSEALRREFRMKKLSRTEKLRLVERHSKKSLLLFEPCCRVLRSARLKGGDHLVEVVRILFHDDEPPTELPSGMSCRP